jgi:protein-disulfide isomerase
MTRVLISGALALGLAAGLAFWMTRAPETPPSLPVGGANATEADSDAAAQPDADSDAAAQPDAENAPEVTEMTLGPADAPVTVMEYASFTCPHCADFHGSTFKKLKADYIDPGKVHYVYRDVYFDRFGLWASMIARCGGEERFFGITEMLYDKQKEWVGAGDPVGIANNLRKIGKAAGLGEDKINACLNNEAKAKALVAWFEENAEEHEIEATPSLVIDGETHENMSYEDLAAIIDEKLAAQ